MVKMLRNASGKNPRLFLGVIGSNLIEILDDNPLVKQLLKRSDFQYKVSDKERMNGPFKRMILTTLSHDALLIFETNPEETAHDDYKIVAFINNSGITTREILQDAQELTYPRWDTRKIFTTSISNVDAVHLVRNGFQLVLSLDNDDIYEKKRK